MEYIIAKSIASSAYEGGGIFHYIKFKMEMNRLTKQKDQIKRYKQYSRVKSEVERNRCETYDDEQFIRMTVMAGGLKKLLERVRREQSPVSKFLETERVFEEDIFPHSYEVPVGRKMYQVKYDAV